MGPSKDSEINKGSNRAYVPLLQVKLIMIGDREAGKTTLLEKLIDHYFKEEEGEKKKDRCPGIAAWEFQWQSTAGSPEKVVIHSWDFNEKEQLYHTYRFFLTRNSIYLLVWEAKPNKSIDIDYWLDTLKRLSPGIPVLVIMNKSDLNTEFIDKEKIKKKFDNIVDFIQVSCVTGKGIPELAGQIHTCLDRLPHVRDKIPKGWIDVYHHLRDLDKDYITLDHYIDICKSCGLTQEQGRLLSGYLHDLGFILYYYPDKLLANTIILDRHWVVDAVYALMEIEKIRENKGVFHIDELGDYWDPVKYPPEIHPQLVHLMEKFELCFNLKGSGLYLIPQLLPEEKPDTPLPRSKEEMPLQFQYHYDYMPGNIIGHLISRLFNLTRDNRWWKNGMELYYEDSTALVLKDPPPRKLMISVTGTWKSELLAITRNSIDSLHQALHMERENHFNEMVPCNCSRCAPSGNPHLYKYDVLKRIAGKQKTVIDCPVSLEEVELSKLLRGTPSRQKENELIELIAQTNGAALPFFKSPKDIIKKTIIREKTESHFSSLSIKKYKALENLNIDKLGRINFFAGENNSGKSSLLEAVYLLANLNNVYSFFDTWRIRGKCEAGLDPTWIHEQFKNFIDIQGVFGNEPVRVRISKEEEEGVKLDQSLYLSTIVIDSGYRGETYDGKARLYQEESPQPLIHSIKVLCNSSLISPFSLLNREEMASFYEKSVKTKAIDKILQFLKTYVDAGIEKIDYVGGLMHRFLVTHRDFDSPVDLTQFGEGMQRIFHIALEFASVENGVLMIDELENAIHYRLLNRFAPFIRQLSREFNTQVFITSHSKECIDAFFKDESENENISAYRLEREGNRIVCKFISGPRLARLIESIDEDLRGNP